MCVGMWVRVGGCGCVGGWGVLGRVCGCGEGCYFGVDCKILCMILDIEINFFNLESQVTFELLYIMLGHLKILNRILFFFFFLLFVLFY